MKTKRIKYKVYKQDKCIQVSYSHTHNEYLEPYFKGTEESQLEQLIQRDLTFYRDSMLTNVHIKVFLEGLLVREVLI